MDQLDDLKIDPPAADPARNRAGADAQCHPVRPLCLGRTLVERTLCDQLGVSRSVVREAIRYLEAEGLVEIMPNKGPMVARMDWAQAEQIYEIRQLLEQNAAAACA